MDNLTQDEQVADSSLLTVFADSDESEADATIENAAPEAFVTVGEGSADDSETLETNEDGEDDEDSEAESDDDESNDEDEDEDEDEDADNGLAENETVPSSETDFPGDTPL